MDDDREDDDARHNETGDEREDEIDVDWEIGRRLGK
jgi:hypothetical protein